MSTLRKHGNSVQQVPEAVRQLRVRAVLVSGRSTDTTSDPILEAWLNEDSHPRGEGGVVYDISESELVELVTRVREDERDNCWGAVAEIVPSELWNGASTEWWIVKADALAAIEAFHVYEEGSNLTAGSTVGSFLNKGDAIPDIEELSLKHELGQNQPKNGDE